MLPDDLFPLKPDASAPQAGDSIERLLAKAEAVLADLAKNEASLRKFPTGFVDERRELWTGLAGWLRRALANPELEADARLEAQRVWAEEMRISALYIVTMCVHVRTESARKFFEREGGLPLMEGFIQQLEAVRPQALRVIAADELAELRKHGYLRPGE